MKELYKGAGMLLAISLCNGGSVGNCLSKSIYNFIVYGESAALPDIEDVVDGEVKQLLTKVYNPYNAKVTSLKNQTPKCRTISIKHYNRGDETKTSHDSDNYRQSGILTTD